MTESIFEKIIAGTVPTEKVYETETVLVIKDIAPVAPIHLLIMPKKHIKDLQSMQPADMHLMVDIVEVAQEMARQYGVEEAYRLVVNNGSSAGQTVFHLHFHLIAGKEFGGLYDAR